MTRLEPDPAEIVSVGDTGPCNVSVCTPTSSCPEVTEIVVHAIATVSNTTVSPLAAAAIAARRLPLPLSLQLATVRLVAIASGEARQKAAARHEASGRRCSDMAVSR